MNSDAKKEKDSCKLVLHLKDAGAKFRPCVKNGKKIYKKWHDYDYSLPTEKLLSGFADNGFKNYKKNNSNGEVECECWLTVSGFEWLSDTLGMAVSENLKKKGVEL